MGHLHVRHHIRDLANDLGAISRRAQPDMIRLVREGVKVGNMLAKDFARESAGRHGRRYPGAFSAEMQPVTGGFGVYRVAGTYGPDAAKPQGNMEFERGSRNQKPHLDLARSADIIGPALVKETGDMIDGWFRSFQ